MILLIAENVRILEGSAIIHLKYRGHVNFQHWDELTRWEDVEQNLLSESRTKLNSSWPSNLSESLIIAFCSTVLRDNIFMMGASVGVQFLEYLLVRSLTFSVITIHVLSLFDYHYLIKFIAKRFSVSEIFLKQMVVLALN